MPVTEIPAVAAYCRVSTEKEDQLHSLQAQQEFFQQYAARCGYQLVGLYTDEGISGTRLNRRLGFQRMMADAERGKFSKVFVKDVSRLARNVVDFLQSIRRLKALGIDCQFITSNMSINDGELTLTIMAAVAQEESANISKRIKFGKAKNAAAGRVPNVIYGYDKVPGEYFTLHINEAEAQVVRKIFHLYVEQGMGEKRIAQLLNEHNIPTKRGCRWQQESVSRLLRHRLYMGEVVNGMESVRDFLTGQREKHPQKQWQVTHRPELAIISQELFQQTQQLLQQRCLPHLAQEKPRGKYPFSTLIRCGVCGYHFRRITRTYRNTYHRWVCSGRNTIGREHCSNPLALDEAMLQQELCQWLRDQIQHPKRVLAQTLELLQQMERPEREPVEQCTIQMKKLEQLREKQLRMFEMDVISSEQLRQRVAQLDAQLQQCRERMEQADTQGGTSAAAALYDSLDTLLSPEHLDHTFWQQVLEEIVVQADGMVTIYVRQMGKGALCP